MKKHKLISLLLALALTAGVLLPGCTPEPTEPTQPSTPTEPSFPSSITIDWNMTAYVLQRDGTAAEGFHYTVKDRFSMTVKDQIRPEDQYSYHHAEIGLPEQFRYKYIPSDAESYGRNPPGAPSGDFTLSDYTYDIWGSRPAFAELVLNVEKEYFFGYWDDGSGTFLVACTDPNVEPMDIVAHFQYFIDIVAG